MDGVFLGLDTVCQRSGDDRFEFHLNRSGAATIPKDPCLNLFAETKC